MTSCNQEKIDNMQSQIEDLQSELITVIMN